MTEEAFKELIDSLKVDLKIFEEMLLDVANDIIKEGFSEYPLFIATAHELKLGELILDKNDHAANFNIYASTLEEMLKLQIILPNRKEEFIKTYKNPKQYMCVMLITEEIASFVFLPYTKGGNS